MTLRDKVALVEQGRVNEFFRETFADWARVSDTVYDRKGGRIAARGLYDREDVRQEIMLAAVEAVHKHDPARGPLLEHMVFVATRDGIRRSVRGSGWTGRDATREFADTPHEPEAFYGIAQEQHADYASRVVQQLVGVAETELEQEVCAMALEHGVADVAAELAAGPAWYGAMDVDEARFLVRRVLRALVERWETAGKKNGQ